MDDVGCRRRVNSGLWVFSSASCSEMLAWLDQHGGPCRSGLGGLDEWAHFFDFLLCIFNLPCNPLVIPPKSRYCRP